jgi:DNA-binding MarR family transcriptional regulator
MSRYFRNDSVAQMQAEWERERPDLDAAPLGISGRVSRVNALVLRHADTWLEPLGLSWETFSMLVTLRRSGKPYALTPTRLYQISLLTSGAMTSRIDRAAELDLVERLPDPDDRRGVLVKLTPAGKRLADRAIAVHLSGVDRLLTTLSRTERTSLATLLGKLLGSLEALPAPKPRRRQAS